MNKLSFPLALLAFCMPLHASGQKAEKIGVVINCSCRDVVGALYATALRDAFAKSPRYTEVVQEKYVNPDKTTGMNWVLSIITIDDGTESSPGLSTAVSVVLKLGPNIFGNHWIQVCGRDMVEKCAAQIVANVDQELHQ